MEEYIKLLDLPDEFDFAILKKSYRKKVMIFHPDKAKDEAQRAEFEAMMKKLNAANDYLKEYLERHDGKYTKPVEEDIKEEFREQEEEETEDYSDSDDYSEHSTDEEAQEESNYEEEYEEDVEHSEILNEDEISNLSLSEKIQYVLKVMFTPNLLNEVLNNPNANPFAPVFGSVKNMLLFIVLLCLLLYPIYNFIDKHVYPDNNQPKQELVQDTTTDRQSPETTQEPNKPLTLEDTAEINDYMGNIQQQIKRNWDLPKNIMAEKGYDKVKVVVNFTVSKEGKLLGEPQIEESSGLDIVDSRCLEAIKLTAPFKPLPECISNDSLNMQFTFEADRY